MPIICPKCGVENRDGAKFCGVCGANLAALPQVLPQSPPQQLPLAPPPAPFPQPQQPLPPVQSGLSPLPGAPAPLPRKRRWFGRAPLLEGEVTVVDQLRQEKAPIDLGRGLVSFSVFALVMGPVIEFVIALVLDVVALALWIVLMVVAGAVLIPIGLILLWPLKALFGAIINWLRGDREVWVLNFQVADMYTNMLTDVILIRGRAGAGNIRLGDKVRIWGMRQRGGVVRAGKIKVYESGGHPTDYVVPGVKPWPIWIGLVSLVIVIGILAYLAVALKLIS